MIDYQHIIMDKKARESLRRFPSEAGKAAICGFLAGVGFFGLSYIGLGPDDYNQKYNYEIKASEKSGVSTFEKAHAESFKLSEIAKKAYQESDCPY